MRIGFLWGLIPPSWAQAQAIYVAGALGPPRLSELPRPVLQVPYGRQPGQDRKVWQSLGECISNTSAPPTRG